MNKSKSTNKIIAQQRKQIEENRARIPMKPILRRNGYDLPFFHGIDSYEEELSRTIAEAKLRYPKLLAVHELDVEDMTRLETPVWFAKHYPQLTLINFSSTDLTDEIIDNYIAAPGGAVSFLKDSAGDWFAVIRLNTSPSEEAGLNEFQCAIKLAILHHELAAR